MSNRKSTPESPLQNPQVSLVSSLEEGEGRVCLPLKGIITEGLIEYILTICLMSHPGHLGSLYVQCSLHYGFTSNSKNSAQ